MTELDMSRLAQVRLFLKSLLESNPCQLNDGQIAHCQIALANIQDMTNPVIQWLEGKHG